MNPFLNMFEIFHNEISKKNKVKTRWHNKKRQTKHQNLTLVEC